MKCNVAFLCILCSLSFNTISASVTDQVSVNSSGQAGLVDCYSANTFGFTRLQVSLTGNFAYDAKLVPQLVRREGFFTDDTLQPFAVLYGIHPAIGFGVTDFLDLSIWQPFYMDVLEGLPPSGSPGDLTVGVKCRIPGNKSRLVQGALLSKLTFPTGDHSEGFFPRHGYYLRKPGPGDDELVDPAAFLTAGKPTWSLTALGTLAVQRFLLHINIGALIPFDSQLDKVITGGVGVEFHPTDGIAFYTDMFAEPRLENLSNGFNIVDDRIHFSPGVVFRTAGGATLALGGTFKLSSNRSLVYRDSVNAMRLTARMEPRWQVFLQLGWGGFLVAHDKDGDLLRDRDDMCLELKEDIDGFEDQDGCPDYDNDKDKIPDEQDSCPSKPEDVDGYQDTDGCPEYDNDNDGIPDSVDKCPNQPEDKDGFEDNDGCPDYDNDHDGISDSLDKCIGIPEDIDGFETDGCPDYDNDTDGIPDSIDQCPDSVGLAVDKGCPKSREKSKEIRRGRLILPGVQFDGGSADLASGASVDIDRVFQSLTDWPEVVLEIQAHTDNSASPEVSLELSQRRADVVRDYLIRKGIVATRLTSAGKGSADPIADNKTIQGRKLNNRIEIHRID